MYRAPIELLYQEPSMVDEIVKGVDDKIEKMVCSAVVNCGVNVDKEELIKALNYDRQQYEQGYKDGYEKAKAEMREVYLHFGDTLNSM